MKFIILLLLSNLAIAETFEFNRMDSFADFEIKFLLTHETDNSNQAVLDCQSFIQKLDFFDEQGSLVSENVIDITECEQIYNNTVSCFNNKQNKCFDTEDIFNTACVCN